MTAQVKACGGVLHPRKYTEYSRVILALTAIGADPRDVAGYDLLVPLGDFERTIAQGVNGAAFALLALDAGEYEIPRNPAAATQATRQMYVDTILARQLPDGGWNLTGGDGARGGYHRHGPSGAGGVSKTGSGECRRGPGGLPA